MPVAADARRRAQAGGGACTDRAHPMLDHPYCYLARASFAPPPRGKKSIFLFFPRLFFIFCPGGLTLNVHHAISNVFFLFQQAHASLRDAGRRGGGANAGEPPEARTRSRWMHRLHMRMPMRARTGQMHKRGTATRPRGAQVHAHTVCGGHLDATAGDGPRGSTIGY